MIQEVISIASTAAGLYILAKNKGEQKAAKTFQQQVEEKASDMFAEKIAEQKAEEAAKDPRYRDMYFGEKDEVYDPFYDYTNDPVYYSEEMLDKINSWQDRMCYAFRCRFVSPILLETKGESTTPFWTDAREGLVNLRVNGVDTFCRDFFAGNIRNYVVMLEVFNPINADAPLKKICFKDIQIDGKDCQVLNVGGYFNVASSTQMYRMNRKYYKDSSSKNATPLEYIPKVYEYLCDIKIPARSSVYVCVVLPLGIQNGSPLLFPCDSFADLRSLAESHAYNMYDPVGGIDTKDIAKTARAFFGEEFAAYIIALNKSTAANKEDIAENLAERMEDYFAGCRGIIVNSFVAPESLRRGSLASKVLLCSSDSNFVQEGDPEGRTPHTDCPAFDLKFLHGSRPKNSDNNPFDWQNSYFNEWESELPMEMSGYDIKANINRLSDVLLEGEKIVYEDFNSKNLG